MSLLHEQLLAHVQLATMSMQDLENYNSQMILPSMHLLAADLHLLAICTYFVIIVISFVHILNKIMVILFVICNLFSGK